LFEGVGARAAEASETTIDAGRRGGQHSADGEKLIPLDIEMEQFAAEIRNT